MAKSFLKFTNTTEIKNSKTTRMRKKPQAEL